MAAGGVVAAAPNLGSLLATAPEDAPDVDGAVTAGGGAITEAEAGAADAGEPVVAHVTDLRSGEISLYQGENEVVLKDPALASRLYRTIAQQGR